MEEPAKAVEEEEVKEFECAKCSLRETYEYFGRDPPYNKRYKYLEDVYAIENPFQPPRHGETLVLGAHCVRCKKSVCKDPQCSFYYEGTYCIDCAKANASAFPQQVQEKLNKVKT